MKPLSEIHVCAIDRMDQSDKDTLRTYLDGDSDALSMQALNMLGEAQMLQIREDSLPQVDALMDAGWRFEPVGENSEPWQWYWRRPPRRKGSKGRLFLSTNQAFMALQREAAEKPPVH